MTDPRHFEAVVDLDDDDPAFAASVAVSDTTVAIHVLDIMIGSWAVTDVAVEHCDEGVLLEVPGSLLWIRTEDADALTACFVDGADTHAGAA